MNINQGGIDRFAQYQGGQGQPGAGGYPSLGGGLQAIPGTGGFNVQSGMQNPLQGRQGNLSGMAGGVAQPNLAGQQRLGGTGGGSQLGLQPPGAGSIGVTGQQFTGAGINGLGQGLRTGGGMGAPSVMNPAGFPSLSQQAAPQQGLGTRPGTTMQTLGGLGPSGMPTNLTLQQRGLAQGSFAALGGGLGGGSRVGMGGAYGPPSGDLLSMLSNKPRQDDGPSFNSSDFPSLSAAGGAGQASVAQDGASDDTFANLLNSQKPVGFMQPSPAFGEEDFPALPGAAGGGTGQQQQTGAGSDVASAAYDALRLQQQRQLQLQQQQQQATSPGLKAHIQKTPGAGPDRFGLLGLLSVIRMTDADVTTLALGTDLTTLGLNLNSPEALWKTFASPWADGPAKPDPEPKIPDCYLTPPPRLLPAYFTRFQPDTLFYIFYGMPGDEAQLYAADELTSRGWYYHKELKAWLTRAPNTEPLQKTERSERGSFFLFDPNTWDVVRKENFTVSFDALERSPGVVAKAGTAAPGPGTGQPPPPGQQPTN